VRIAAIQMKILCFALDAGQNVKKRMNMNTDIIQVLQKSRAPNVFYHKECYASQEHHKEDLVLEVLRLKDDVKCAKCDIMI
jgi:hypothetical protein